MQVSENPAMDQWFSSIFGLQITVPQQTLPPKVLPQLFVAEKKMFSLNKPKEGCQLDERDKNPTENGNWSQTQ